MRFTIIDFDERDILGFVKMNKEIIKQHLNTKVDDKFKPIKVKVLLSDDRIFLAYAIEMNGSMFNFIKMKILSEFKDFINRIKHRYTHSLHVRYGWHKYKNEVIIEC